MLHNRYVIGGVFAMAVAFFALLSLLGLIVLVYGFFADPLTLIEHMRALTTVLPTDVATIIGDQLMTAVKASEGTKSVGILIAFVVATYGGTNGAAAVITALRPRSRRCRASSSYRRAAAVCCS